MARSGRTKIGQAQGLNPEDWARFIELPYFRKKWKELGLTDDDLRALQIALTLFPARGSVMSGTGGLRKVRFARQADNRGKSGSYRIGYVYFEEFSVIALIAVYAKSDQANISLGQRKEIRKAIDDVHRWISMR